MGSSSTNRALWLESFDTAPELIDLPIPTASAGSVVVRILATGIMPYAHLLHTGKLPQLNLHLPLVPNPTSIARVHAIGPDTTRLKEGDLVYVDPTIHARDDPSNVIMQGHHGGAGPEGKKLMQGEWRDGSLQQFQKVPLENCLLLDEQTLFHKYGYTPAEMTPIPLFQVAAGAVLEAAGLRAAQTIVIGPSGGNFGGAAVELALAVGANVIALGRSADKLAAMKAALGDDPRLSYVVMTGDVQRDAEAIVRLTPGQAGADVYNDWTPGTVDEPPFFDAGLRALKTGGRVVVSGGAKGTAKIPYAYMVHKSLTVGGKWMSSRETLQMVITMIMQGTLKVGRKYGSQVETFELEEHEKAMEHAERTGAWRNYTVVLPNKA